MRIATMRIAKMRTANTWRRLPRRLALYGLHALPLLSALSLVLVILAAAGGNLRLGVGAAALAPLDAAPTTAPPTAGPSPRGAPLPPPGRVVDGHYLATPAELWAAYSIAPLLRLGFTGRGQTVVVIDSFGSPTLADDLAVFDAFYGLPPAQLRVLAPLGTRPFDATDPDMAFWARETAEDVETVHAIAPEAGIVVLTSPVDQTQGTAGLAEFRQLAQYALDHHLGGVLSQSWGASEATLNTAAGRAEVARWDAVFAAARDAGISCFASSGDHGATDWADASLTHLASTPTTNFPADDPWVTGVGGTTLQRGASGYAEAAWSDSGGGFSALFGQPEYQRLLPARAQSLLGARRGVPDISAIADRTNGLGIYTRGVWRVAAGTSASVPFWAALAAIADQMAGRPLGLLNPALYALATSPAHAGDFYDITSGNNSYSRWDVSVKGYDATPGWDPVTGLGTPNAAKLLPDLVALMLARSPGAAQP